MKRVRIFISSPGDVADERQRALTVVERLQPEFGDTLALEPLLWEQEPLLATADFQSQIRSPADFDIFVTIIGSRLGSPLGSQFTRRDGTPYASGTEFEFEVAVASHHASGRPELLFYRKSLPPDQPATPQLEKVEAFFDKWFPRGGNGGNGGTIGEYHTFAETGQFEELLTEHLREVLRRFLPRPNNLPAPISSFLGRVEEIREISRLVKQSNVRLINLIGPSGVGKSRLALRTARGLLPEFQNGVFLVNPVPSDHEDAVPAAMAAALGIKPDAERPVLDNVVDQLRDKQILLLVDTDQDGVPALPVLLAECPGVKVLLTSCEALPISDATTITVEPFPLPDLSEASFADIRDSECVQLFVERAQVAREDFELTQENAREVLDICHQLGGLPRSVELAASRMRSMSTTKMLRSLGSIKVKDDSGNTVYLIPR